MKKLHTKALFIVMMSAGLLLSGCATKTGTGAAWGAGAGALIGGLFGGSRGAVAGAAVGGITGAAAGAHEEDKDRMRRQRYR